ncbi:MAG: hypothetical protein B7Y39_07330 [Bdellovibrio sp. 28-41-41]|nr:MAG: hypothetical protein B7Y39_07330 [Bdellovibrio sp. 28-41-41]
MFFYNGNCLSSQSDDKYFSADFNSPLISNIISSKPYALRMRRIRRSLRVSSDRNSSATATTTKHREKKTATAWVKIFESGALPLFLEFRYKLGLPIE